MSKVVKFPAPPTPDEILDNAKGQYEQVMVVGWGSDGLLNLAGNIDTAEAVLILEAAKHEFIRAMFGGEDESVH